MIEEFEINKVYNESCLETMKRMPDDLVDLVITSPPYNMNLRIRNGKYCSRQVVKEFSTKYAHYSDNLPIDEFYELHSSVLKELLRVSKIIFYNIQNRNGKQAGIFQNHRRIFRLFERYSCLGQRLRATGNGKQCA